MPPDFFQNPGLTLGLALAFGMLCQSAAHHLRIPGIVLLLFSGVILGPDVFGVIQPDSLGASLVSITGFAVAVILFEGGMNLSLRRLRREQKSIRRLVGLGGALTVALGMLAARFILHWDLRTSFLFGTLIMVTGPTVVTPLLRRLKVKHKVATVLEAEGVFIDALGAVVAAVALEAALAPPGAGARVFFTHVLSCLGFAAVFGLSAGFILGRLLNRRGLIPEGAENVFTLCMVLALFQIANAVFPESGIAAVTIAGIVVGNTESHVRRDLAEFKEQLTLMLVGMLFVLLAADVRIASVLELGPAPLLVVAAIMFLVRPSAVFLSTVGTGLTKKEKAFISWIGPRGIIAAAVASLFAVKMNNAGIAGGNELRATVFIVITVTVLSAGLTGGLVARLLGLQRPRDSGWVILGANELARAVAIVLRENGDEVVMIDANPDTSQAAERDCTRVIFGNGLKTVNLLRAEVDTRAGALALTPNAEVNLFFIQKVKQETRLQRLFLAQDDSHAGLTREMVRNAGAQLAFGGVQDVNLWSVRLQRNQVKLLRCQWEKPEAEDADKDPMLSSTYCIPLAVKRNGRILPVGDETRFKTGDKASFLVHESQVDSIARALEKKGWQALEGGEDFTLSLCYLPGRRSKV